MDALTLELGDLEAYLDGAMLPHVEQALQHSAELRHQLAELRETDRALRRYVAGLPIAEPQDLVDVATGQATPAQQLRVAAYVRANTQARQALTDLLALHAEAPSRSGRFSLPRFVALPLAMASGVRALAPTATEQSFYASELAALVVLRVIPPSGEHWRLEGYITQNEQPASAVRVTLRSAQSRPRPRLTDADGFFSFDRLSAGDYVLQAHFAQGVVLLPAIVLHRA